MNYELPKTNTVKNLVKEKVSLIDHTIDTNKECYIALCLKALLEKKPEADINDYKMCTAMDWEGQGYIQKFWLEKKHA